MTTLIIIVFVLIVLAVLVRRAKDGYHQQTENTNHNSLDDVVEFLEDCNKAANTFAKTIHLKAERTNSHRQQAHQLRMKKIPLEEELKAYELSCRMSESEFNELKSQGLIKSNEKFPPDKARGEQLRIAISKIDQELKMIDLEIESVKEQCEQEGSKPFS